MSKLRRERRDRERPAGKRLTTPEAHKQFISDNWDHLAAAAWRGYQEDGRGFIDVFVDKVQEEPARGERFPQFVAFVSKKVLLEKGVKFPNPKVEALVEGYAPEESVVFLFHWQDGESERHSAYRVLSTPLPRDTVYLGDVGQLKVRT